MHTRENGVSKIQRQKDSINDRKETGNFRSINTESGTKLAK